MTSSRAGIGARAVRSLCCNDIPNAHSSREGDSQGGTSPHTCPCATSFARSLKQNQCNNVLASFLTRIRHVPAQSLHLRSGAIPHASSGQTTIARLHSTTYLSAGSSVWLRNLHGTGFGHSSASRCTPHGPRVATRRGRSEKRMRRCGPLAGGPADVVRVWVSRVASSSPRASRVLAEPRPLSVAHRALALLPGSALHIDGCHGKPTCRVRVYTII
jgi:hypothetical protein